jgi:hypothetical protein
VRARQPQGGSGEGQLPNWKLIFAFPRSQQGRRGTDEDEDEEEGRRWRYVIPVERDAWVVGGLVRGKLNGAFFLLSTGSILQFPT